MKNYTLILFVLAQFVFNSANVLGAECKDEIPTNDNGVVVGGTFMLTLEGNEYKVNSYIPSGTIVKIKNHEIIKKYRKGLKPKKECYYKIVTNLGKSGFVLQEEAEALSSYAGEYIFPRTEVNIYKEPSLEKIASYLNKKISPKEIFLSSVAPKQKKQLKVLSVTDDELFYEVTADFLGTKGYFPVSNVQKGLAALTDTDDISFGNHEIHFRGEGFLKIMETLLPAKAFKELNEKAKSVVRNIRRKKNGSDQGNTMQHIEFTIKRAGIYRSLALRRPISVAK